MKIILYFLILFCFVVYRIYSQIEHPVDLIFVIFLFVNQCFFLSEIDRFVIFEHLISWGNTPENNFLCFVLQNFDLYYYD